MPRKRKSSIGPKAAAAKRKHMKRQQETEEEQDVRLNEQAQWQQQQRQNETEEERSARLNEQAHRQQQRRANETEEECDARLEAMRHRTAEARALARAQEHNNANRVAFTYDPADPTTHADIGQVVLEPSPALPPLLKELLSGEGPLSKHFLDNIRMYNGSLAMMSSGHKEAEAQGWNPSFQIQGQVFHRIGSLLPPEEGQPKFLQVYFLDSHTKELSARNHSDLKPHILEMLTKWFHKNNHLLRKLKTARDVPAERGNSEERQIIIRENKRPQ